MHAVASSLREQRKLRTTADIAAAALELFSARGYADVTVAEVAAAAQVGERTLYRYFADKEDLLFAEDESMREHLRAAIDHQDAGDPPFTALRKASTVVARELDSRRDDVRRRSEVIASAPALAARERAKQADWETVLAEALRDRGIPANESRLLARIAVACYDEAVTRWLDGDKPQRKLDATLDDVFTEAAALTPR